jgi:hypothetical protein
MKFPDPTRLWTRRKLLETGTAVVATGLLPKTLRGQCAAGAAALVNPQPVPAGPMTVSTVAVSATPAGSIPLSFMGLAFDKVEITHGYLNGSNTHLINLCKSLGPGVFRLGGDSVDSTVWTPNGAGSVTGQVAPSDITNLAAFIAATGWKCIYGVNLGGSYNGTTTPTLAAQEVAFATTAFGSSLAGILIGNEEDNWGVTGSYYPGNWSLAQFMNLWTTYRNAILAAVPGTVFVGPEAAAKSSTWTKPFAIGETSSNMSLITQHYYRGDGTSPSSTAAQLISPDTTLTGNVLSSLSSAKASTGLPFRLTESSSYFDGGVSGASNAFASTLWIIDFLFNLAQYGAAGVCLSAGPGGTDSPMGIPSSGVVDAVRPMFYGMKFFTFAGVGTLYSTSIQAGSLNATAYTVRSASGGLNLVVNNKDATQNLQLSVQLPQTISTATLVQLAQLSSGATAPSLSATSGVTIQGATIDLDGSIAPGASYTLAANGSQITCYVPALSAVLIQMS